MAYSHFYDGKNMFWQSTSKNNHVFRYMYLWSKNIDYSKCFNVIVISLSLYLECSSLKIIF